MKKLLMWAVGVPFLVAGMAMISFAAGDGNWIEGGPQASVVNGH